MEAEASFIARKIRSQIQIENKIHRHPAAAAKVAVKKEPGILRNLILVSLMGVAVVLTELTVFIVKGVRRLESV